MVVLQQDEHSSVNNSRPAGEEVTGTRKKSDRDIGENEEKEKGSEVKWSEVKVQFKREPLIIFHD